MATVASSDGVHTTGDVRKSTSVGSSHQEPAVGGNSNDERDDSVEIFCNRDVGIRNCDVLCELWPFTKEREEEENSNIETAKEIGRTRTALSNSSSAVTRKEIFSLSREESARFVAAVKKLMENNPKHEPETSEWFRIAGYHGWPSDYCSHGEETFPSWHRAYLLEMETALRKADKELGNDGKIGLPYWDWIRNPSFPPIIREHFSDLPSEFFEPGSDGASITLNRRNTDQTIALNLRNANLEQLVEDCLRVDEHWKHASTRWRLGSSLETPHNSVHVAIGYPMSTVAAAAFDPVFWLHHSNVDRIHEVYLRRHPDSLKEFEATQRRLAQERGEEDRFTKLLDPFLHPTTEKPFKPTDSFELKELGYRYDDLMEPSILDGVTDRALNVCGDAALSETKPKVLCFFRDISVLSLKKKSYMLYVLLFPTKEAASKWNPLSNELSVQALVSMPEFAGIGSIFGGKGNECSNCRTRKPYNVIVNVTGAIQKLGISSLEECSVEVVAIDEVGAICRLEETPVPQPELIRDCAFDINRPQLTMDSKGSDATSLQRLLVRSGWYGGKVDSEFGPKTDSALKLFQTFHRLKSDGIAGPITKKFLLQRRYDSSPDMQEKNKEEDSEDLSPDSTTAMSYWLGACPGYLNRDSVLLELSDALDWWNQVSGVDFNFVKQEADADLKIQFVDDINDDISLDILLSGGGELGCAGKNFIHLDATQRWLLSFSTAEKGYKIKPVILHLIGHSLGFGHVSHKSSIMYPIYDPTKLTLNAVDRALLCSRASC